MPQSDFLDAAAGERYDFAHFEFIMRGLGGGAPHSSPGPGLQYQR